MKTAIIIDSTAYASEELISHPDIYELKFTARFDDGVEFLDSSDPIIQEQFYTKLQMEETLPKTSQPAPGKYMGLIEAIIEKGYDQVLCIHISRPFSGIYQTAQMVTTDYAEQITAKIVDSKGTSLVIEAMVIQALEMLDKGLALQEIYEKLDWVARKSTIYLTVSDLENVVKGGRLRPTQAIIGNMLKIKPLLVVGESGEVQLLDKIRTDKRMNRRLAQIAKEAVTKYPNGIMLGFAHALDKQRMTVAIETVIKAVPNHNPQTATLGPVIGTHTGTGAIGMAIIPIASY